MPAEEVAFIHDADTEAKKKDLFAKVRTGQVRVLLVSYVIGILLLVIGGSAIYCIVKALWQSLLILVVLGIATIAVVFLLVWAVMKAENIGESLGAFIRS